MASLADNLVPPYYAAIIENQPHSDIDEPFNATDRMVTMAVRRPGFLGLETARSTDGRPLTVCYWRDMADVEGWRHAVPKSATDQFPLEVRKVANRNDPPLPLDAVVVADGNLAWRSV